eukprot:13816508-Alexandrium_andersonii.AAC.1
MDGAAGVAAAIQAPPRGGPRGCPEDANAPQRPEFLQPRRPGGPLSASAAANAARRTPPGACLLYTSPSPRD